MHSALSFVGADWPILFAKPFQLDGVWITWPARLGDLIIEDGPLSAGSIDHIARELARKLPAK